jgi:tetratricopeptide (TPR) repeat protein
MFNKQNLFSGKPRLTLWIIFIAIVLLVFVFYSQMKNSKNGESGNYIIPNISYIGLYNHTGQNGYLGYDKSSTMAMLLEYWNPGMNNFDHVRRAFSVLQENKSLPSLTNVASVVQGLGDYSTKTEHLEISELKKYINSETRTPLILFLPISTDQPTDIAYRPLTLLIGQNDTDKKLIFHDFWMGNNYEISYDKFNKLQERMRAEERNNYLIAQPKNFSEAIKNIKKRSASPYTGRTKLMDQIASMIKDFNVGYGASVMKQDKEMIEFFSKVEKSTTFNDIFPSPLKVSTYYYLGSAYLMQGNYENSLSYARKAIALDQDLDKPVSDWPGYEYKWNKPSFYGVNSSPYVLQGDIQYAQNNFAAAKDSYAKAFEIYARNINIREKLQLAEQRLSGK